MLKLNPSDERGISVVLSAALLIGIGITTFSVFLAVWVPDEIYRMEHKHMLEVKEDFLELKSRLGSLQAGGPASLGVKMSADSIPFIPGPKRAGTLFVDSAAVRTVEIFPSDDAYVVEDLPDDNFGAEDSLRVESKLNNNQRTFLKFSLENIPAGSTILKAELWLYCKDYGSPIREVTDMQCYPVNNDWWSEDNLTWNNQPPMGNIPLDSLFVDEVGWISLTAKDLVSQEVRDDQIVSLGLKAKRENYDNIERYISFSSKKAGGKDPYLQVTYVVVGVNFFTNRIDVSPDVYGSWQDIDVSSYVPAGATGAICEIEKIRKKEEEKAKVRAKGSTDNRIDDAYLRKIPPAKPGTNFVVATVKLDGYRRFQGYLDSPQIKIYLIGYTGDNVVLFTNGIDCSLDTVNAWTEIDLSAYVPADATGIIMEVVNTASDNQYAGIVRKRGSADDFSTRSKIMENSYQYYHMGVDNGKVEGWIENEAVKFYLVGYTKLPVTFFTNARDITPSSSPSWIDVDVTAETEATADGVFLLHLRHSGSPPTWSERYRKKGSTDYAENPETKIVDNGARGQCIGIDSDQIFESYNPRSGSKLYLEGYTKSEKLKYYSPYGDVGFEARNSFYPSQTYVCEGGTVILVQDGVDLMVSKPKMVTASDAGGENIRIDVDIWVIKREKASTTSTGMGTVRMSCGNSRHTVVPVGRPNRENVVLEVTSVHRNAWGEYLREICEELNAEGYNASYSESLSGLTLTILGRDSAAGVKDIFYYEKVTEVEVYIT